MSVRKRILSIRLSEKLQRNPEYANKIGVSIKINREKTREKKKP